MLQATKEKQNDLIVVGISELGVSPDAAKTLVTYSLGSCLGVAIHDARARVAGLIHCMLPLSKEARKRDDFNPAMFVDTGVVVLLNSLFELGATREGMVVKVAGCGSPMDQCNRFRIGERNYTVLRKILWKNELMITGEDVGGSCPRTLRLSVSTGVTTIRTPDGEAEL